MWIRHSLLFSNNHPFYRLNDIIHVFELADDEFQSLKLI